MKYRSVSNLAITLGLLAGYQAASAEPPSVNSWQMKRLFQPSQADLKSEAKGRVMIYDGMTDKMVERALSEEFQRVDAMMFTRVVVTDADGEPRRDPESGEVVYQDDGCD